MTKYFTKEHEWIAIENDIATVGITDYAQEQLGDVVFVELPEDGTKVNKGDQVAVVESVKAASDIFAPLSGVIIETNSKIVNSPDFINSDANQDAWFFKIQLSNLDELSELMDEDSYKNFIK